jgi:hypothetical protein
MQRGASQFPSVRRAERADIGSPTTPEERSTAFLEASESTRGRSDSRRGEGHDDRGNGPTCLRLDS